MEINFSKRLVINYELLKYKSLGQAFSKACGVQRQSLGRSSQWAKSPVQTAKLSNHKANCQRSWQFAFVRWALRKGWISKQSSGLFWKRVPAFHQILDLDWNANARLTPCKWGRLLSKGTNSLYLTNYWWRANERANCFYHLLYNLRDVDGYVPYKCVM